MSSFFGFHPIIAKWFNSRFTAPTEPQELGWPAIAAGKHTLIAAPTGSGKTLAAFLACIDRLLKESLEQPLKNEFRVVYVSPLRALSNDMHRNLEVPLAEITALAEAEGVTLPPIRVGLRTGDTSASKRASLVRRPPHILVTTPESLYLMLTAEKSREKLRNVNTVIVDEIHALVRDKRGSHLSLTLERLAALCEGPVQRIGLSATQKPIERVAEFLIGSGNERGENSATRISQSAIDCQIIDVGHSRELDLAVEVPPSELGAVCMHEQWEEINARLVELINEHRSTLIFVNTRRMAERVTHQLTELLGEDAVGAHHGSLSTEIRLETERRLKKGELKAVVATASLELGLDIGYIDLVIQIGSPRSIATFLQRIGRSGHSLGLVPKGRLFALTRDELLECMALIRAVRAGRLDAVPIPEAPLDILAQQIVAEVSAEEWGTDDLFALCRRAYPYRNLSRKQFDSTVEFLSEGITRATGRGRVYLHHDRVGRRLRPRKGARIAAVTNGGAIPEVASYRVVADPDGTVVGSLDEEFSIESQAGDVFLLGNTSWRILNVRGGDVNVVDAQGAPPSIPFWNGEAPGRTIELSEEISRLRDDLESLVGQARLLEQDVDHDKSAIRNPQSAFDSQIACLSTETGTTKSAAAQALHYAAAQKGAIGLLPTQKRIVFERFFDESGGMQLVVHAPFGAAINRAWGLAMRKRFCRSFDFELQATADDDGFILSLGPQHSFPIESLFPMLTPRNVRSLLEQAVLAIPMFQIRWRWNVTRALLVLRREFGKKVPPAFQRFRADDLLTAVFPKLTGCQENITGDHEIPDHPLTRQTMDDCLHEALDIDGLERVLADIERGEITLIARDTREPSPFSYELLNSNPYAFLDGGELQERRARAVSTRRSMTVESVSDLGRLDPAAIEVVRQEAQPSVRSADELHDVLLSRIVLPVDELPEGETFYRDLVESSRATTMLLPEGRAVWVAAERLPTAIAAFPTAACEPSIDVPDGVRTEWTAIDARLEMLRGLIEVCGPITAADVAARTSITAEQAAASLEALEGEGVVLRGRFSPDLGASQTEIEWCHRRLLARIHRLTLQGLRAQIQPVSVDVFVRFLTRHHRLLAADRRTGSNGLYEAIAMLQGIDMPAVCWERDLLSARVEDYRSQWLDELCLAGEIGWSRLFPPRRNPERSKPMASLTRVAPLSVYLRGDLPWLSSNEMPHNETPGDTLSSPAREVRELLQQCGAMFANDLMAETQMLPGQIDDVLGELVTRGVITADGFGGLRKLIAGDRASTSRRRRVRPGIARQRNAAGGTGRWSLCVGESKDEGQEPKTSETVEQWAWQLLRRWGVVFRDLLVREQGTPSWFELLRVYRRLEARGEIRGGRFVAGVAGEQFALGETIRQLRALRDEGPQQELVFLCAADPLNLVGILTDHPRIPSTASNRVAYLDGKPVAAFQGGEVLWLGDVPDELRQTIGLRLEKPGVPIPADFTPSTTEADSGSSERRGNRRSRRRGIPRPIIS
jgi:ATP-dependent Lhr-like helicase